MIRRELFLFFLIILLGIFTSVALGFINDGFIDKGSRSYNKIASNLIHHNSFHDDEMLFPAFFRRAPGYPMILAFSYLIFGENYFSVVAFNMMVWVASLILLWKVSRHFLSGFFALLPSLMLSLWWGAASHVFETNSDLFAMFLTLFFTFFILRYQHEQASLSIIGAGALLAFLILTKPVVLYAAPFLIILFIFTVKPFSSQSMIGGLVALAIIVISVGSWSLYSYRLFGTWQLSSGALTLLRRADDVLMPRERIKAFIVSSLAGDYVADQFYPGYALNPETGPEAVVAREKYYQDLLLPDRSNDTEVQELAYSEAASLIKQSPIKFFLTGFIYVFRLNMPVNLSGVELSHMFVGTHTYLSHSAKTIILASVFLIWYVFVGIVFVTLFKMVREWRMWGMIIFLVFYFNATQALLTHSEARYLLPVMPFYFLLFSFFLANCISNTRISPR